MSITSLAQKLYFAPRQRELEKHNNQGPELQRHVLASLLERADDTEYGRKHAFSAIKDYDTFCQDVPLNDYESLKQDIDRMRHGERNILWPGQVKWYAKSSGTTNDKSKFIPVSSEGLQRMHYAGPKDCVAFYLEQNPKSRIFDGRALILGGSHQSNYNVHGSLVGDLSAILIENINPLANLVRVPKKKTALLSDFEVKRDRIARESLNKNVTNISMRISVTMQAHDWTEYGELCPAFQKFNKCRIFRVSVHETTDVCVPPRETSNTHAQALGDRIFKAFPC